MSDALLLTKLYVPPPRPGLIPRPYLVQLLNEGLAKERRLTLVSAPAGFGKTTLVSEWLWGCGRPVAWLSLDEGDDDPNRFLAYLVAALQTIYPKLGTNLLTSLQSPQSQPIESSLTVLLNEITTNAGRFILVLDDYHTIVSKTVDDTLSFLLEHQPAHMHLVIVTREDPSLPLARLRARNQLTELRAVHLRFSPAEAAEFLKRIMGLNLSEEDVTALEARTEGWIAGLQMAALSMQGQEDPASFIKSLTGSHRYILDYLLEEVLDHQSEEVQTFMLYTSILDRLCASLCARVLDLPASFAQETLEYLERANLFIVSLDEERRWYRYHHLFGDLLRQRFSQSKELREIHRRASEWYEENNYMMEAYHHAFEASDFERAAILVDAAWQFMEHNFQTSAWLTWVKKLPKNVVCSNPWLCVHISWAYSDVGELEPSEAYLQYAEHALENDLVEFKTIPATIALIRAGNAQIEGNLPETVRYAEMTLQLIPESEFLIRTQAAITLGFTQWAVGNVEASLQAMNSWIQDMKQMDNQLYAIASAFVVADMQAILGHLDDAEQTLLQTIQIAKSLGEEADAVTAHTHLGLAMLSHERGDDIDTEQRLLKVTALSHQTTLVDWAYRWGVAQARIKESRREWDEALNSLDKAWQGYIKNPIPMLQPVESRKVRIYLKQGRLDKAQTWARERGLSVYGEINYLTEYEYLTLARMRIAEKSFEGIIDLLIRLLKLAETQKRKGSMIEILLVQALLHQALGNQVPALQSLEDAMRLAEPERYFRIFVDEGDAMRELIEQLSRKRDYELGSYAKKLLAAYSQPAAKKKSASVNQGAAMFEPLSDRELEVLRLLGSDLSGPEIAGQLIVSLNTLRSHTKNIFVKLGVNSRRAAIRRAEELDLV